jgi:hypothetical protein
MPATIATRASGLVSVERAMRSPLGTRPGWALRRTVPAALVSPLKGG